MTHNELLEKLQQIVETPYADWDDIVHNLSIDEMQEIRRYVESAIQRYTLISEYLEY